MGEFISTRTHPLQGHFKHQMVVVIKPNYFLQELGLTPCSIRKVAKGIDSNYLKVIKASDFFPSRPDTWQDSRGRLGKGSNAKTARNSEM